MARPGYVLATKNGVQREFSEYCWKFMGANKQGWRLVNEGEQAEVEITEKKNLAQFHLQESVVEKSEDIHIIEQDDVPGVTEQPEETAAPKKKRGPNKKK